MSMDRRLSLRTRVDLPFVWRPLTERLNASELCEWFQLPVIVQLQGRLTELDTELDHALHNISDSTTVAALQLLNTKLDVLSEAQEVEAPVPAKKSIELSANGVGFETTEALKCGSWIGIHIVLPTVFHMLGNARVNNCNEREECFWIGAELLDLDPATAKKLTRFVIGSKIL